MRARLSHLRGKSRRTPAGPVASRTADIFDNTLLPGPFSLENYTKVFDGSTVFAQALLNSLIVAGTTTAFALLLGVVAA